jgi:hypothetical protein
MSAEVMVSISDFALAGFSGLLAAKLQSRATEMRRTQRWFTIVLGAIAFSALLGGIAHGFVPDERSRLGALVWRATLMAVGPSAIGLWMLASLLLFKPAAVERARTLGLIALAIYVGVVLFEYQNFMIALAMYLPAAVLLMIGFAVELRRRADSFAMDGLIAMALTLVAGLLQYLRVDFHPVFFNHNAVYHLFQGIAVYFLYRAGSKWLDPNGSKLPVLKSQPLIAKIG